MKRIFMLTIAVLAITTLASEAAFAGHGAGACGFGFRRGRVERHRAAGDCGAGLLGRTRLRDGDGRPLLRAK